MRTHDLWQFRLLSTISTFTQDFLSSLSILNTFGNFKNDFKAILIQAETTYRNFVKGK